MPTAMISGPRTAYLVALVALVCVSCSSTTGPSEVDPPEGAIPTRTVAGEIALPEGATLDPAALSVVSLADAAAVGGDGSFSLSIPDTDVSQTLAVVDAGGEMVLMGVVSRSASSGIVVDAGSTATALLRMNPFMTMFSESNRAVMVERAEIKPGWTTLVRMVEDALCGPDGRLRGPALSDASQQSSELVIDALNDEPPQPSTLTDPWLEDVEGDSVSWVNPDPVCYAAVFRSLTSADSLVVPVSVERTRIRVTPGWPPSVHVSGSTRTHVDIGDGTYRTRLVDASFRTFDSSSPDGVATARNAGRAVTELIALVSGAVVERETFDLDMARRGASELGGAVSARDPYRLIRSLASLMADGSDEVAQWIWDGPNPSCSDFVSALCPVLAEVTFATGIMAGGESRVPFFDRLVTSDPRVELTISQLDGVMTETGSSEPPSAAFTVSHSYAAPGQSVTFDASAVADPDDPTETLAVRWDWENDGEWDTGWSTTKTATHAYSTAGAREVAMQVRDPRLLNDSAVHTVNVGGSEETAIHVVILRDVVPWADEIPAVLDQMLEVMGFEAGSGPGEYEVASAASLPDIALVPGEDLLIVQNDQPQSFYNDYAASQVRVQRFVEEGGTVFWEACDRGWQGGSIESAGIVLPGNVTLSEYETWYNYVALPGAPLVEGLPDLLYGQYASHEALESLPDGAVVYVTDDAGGATLAEYGVGDGWVLISTQPLEWNFYHNWSGGHVMPHVVCHVLGLPLTHDFGDIVKPERRGAPSDSGGGLGLTSGMH